MMSRNGTNGTRTPVGRVDPPVSVRRRWNSTRVLVGVAVVVVCGLAAMVLFSSVADRSAVLVVVRDVPAGAEITEADLGSAAVSADGKVRSVAVDRASEVVGRTAAVDLSAGSLLNPDQVTDAAPLPDGTVIAAAILADGQAPVDLAVGDAVEVVETSPPDASGTANAVSRGPATVLAIDRPDSGDGHSVVSLALASDAAVDVSAAGAAGRLSLVVRP